MGNNVVVHRTENELYLYNASADGNLGNVQYALGEEGINSFFHTKYGNRGADIDIDRGADIDIDINWQNPEDDGKTALIIATRNGHLEVVRELIRAGADVNQSDYYDNVPIFWAAIHGFLEIANALIQAGADVNKKNSGDQTAVFFATQHNQNRVLALILPICDKAEILFLKGQDPDDEWELRKTPLYVAVENGNYAAARMLLNSVPDTMKRIMSVKPASDREINPVNSRTPLQKAEDNVNQANNDENRVLLRRIVELLEQYIVKIKMPSQTSRLSTRSSMPSRFGGRKTKKIIGKRRKTIRRRRKTIGKRRR